MIDLGRFNFPEIQKGVLYLVATPIGNLGDITLRALHTLINVEAIFCEDTRISNHLLKSYGLKKSLYLYHDHSTKEERHHVIRRLKSGQSVALLSDAGTPLISDPGYKLVTECYLENIPVTLIPGPCALIHGLVISGLPTDQFYFGGFLPLKEKDRQEKLVFLSRFPATLIFYETPQKLLKTLKDLNMFFKDRTLVITRELTKKFESIHSDTVDNLISYYEKEPLPKGELVLILEGYKHPVHHAPLDPVACKKIIEKMSLKEAAEILSLLFKRSKNDLYKEFLMLKDEKR